MTEDKSSSDSDLVASEPESDKSENERPAKTQRRVIAGSDDDSSDAGGGLEISTPPSPKASGDEGDDEAPKTKKKARVISS